MISASSSALLREDDVPDVMMKCGHRAAGESNGKPACVICLGLDQNATVVDEGYKVPEGRKARCTYYGSMVRGEVCKSEQPSSLSLAFFERRPEKEFDSFYCGCYGWD